MRVKNTKHAAFTLAETLITIGLLAVIAAIVTPTLGLVKPNKTKAMFTKTYQVAERIIYELVNDPILYPDNGLQGFDNVARVSLNGTNYEGKQKFAGLFATKLNTLSTNVTGLDTTNSSWTDNSELASNQLSFITTDGVFWALPLTNFTVKAATEDNPNKSSPKLAYKKIYIDVNGNKGPNKMDSESSDATCSENVDRFTLYVRTDGQIRVKGVCAREYLNEANMLDSNEHGALGAAINDTDLIVVEDDGDDHDSSTVNHDDTDFDGETGNFNPADEESPADEE